MTNKEAIKILSNRDSFGIPKGYTSGYAEAIDMAIKALSKMAEECGGWREKENEFYNRNA